MIAHVSYLIRITLVYSFFFIFLDCNFFFLSFFKLNLSILSSSLRAKVTRLTLIKELHKLKMKLKSALQNMKKKSLENVWQNCQMVLLYSRSVGIVELYYVHISLFNSFPPSHSNLPLFPFLFFLPKPI